MPVGLRGNGGGGAAAFTEFALAGILCKVVVHLLVLLQPFKFAATGLVKLLHLELNTSMWISNSDSHIES